MLDGVEVWGIRRQEQKRCAGFLDKLHGFRRFVKGRIVHDDEVMVIQARAQPRLHP